MDKLNGGYNLIFMYLLSALAGNVYETIMFLFRRHKFVWSNGSITTPFNFVYGIGAVAICISTIWVSDHWWAVMICGALLGGIRQFLDTCDAKAVVDTVRSGKNYDFEVNGKPVSLSLDDLLISSEPAEGYVSESTDGLTVVLDAHVSEELLMEGTVREIVSRVQNMRKEAGFNVTDRIVLGYTAEGVSEKAFKSLGKDIAGDVLAEKLVNEIFDGYKKDFDINGDKVTLVVKKV